MKAQEYTGPTPYDVEIAVLENRAVGLADRQRLAQLLVQRIGYRMAKAEDADALEAALAHVAELHQTTGGLLSCVVADRIRAALGKT